MVIKISSITNTDLKFIICCRIKNKKKCNKVQFVFEGGEYYLFDN